MLFLVYISGLATKKPLTVISTVYLVAFEALCAIVRFQLVLCGSRCHRILSEFES